MQRCCCSCSASSAVEEGKSAERSVSEGCTGVGSSADRSTLGKCRASPVEPCAVQHESCYSSRAHGRCSLHSSPFRNQGSHKVFGL